VVPSSRVCSIPTLDLLDTSNFFLGETRVILCSSALGQESHAGKSRSSFVDKKEAVRNVL